MPVSVADVDRAIARRIEQSGRFTVVQLREDLGLGPDSPEAKNLSNRIHRLYKKMNVLKNDGINERNMTYVFANDKQAGRFKRGLTGASQPATSEPPIKRLARLAELDGIKGTILQMANKIDRIERLVGELHAGLFEVESAPKSLRKD